MALGCCLLWAGLALAAEEWVIRHFTTAEGLPVSSASAARIDRDGFLWLATHDGLARFDGRRFEIFDMAAWPDMDSNRINGLYSDGLGRLHALTSQGSLLKVRANRIERIIIDQAQPDQRALSVDESPFCVTLSHALFCHDEAGQFRLRTQIEPSLDVRHALRASGESIWLVGRTGAVWLHPDDGPARQVLAASHGEIPSSALPLVLPDGSIIIPQFDGLIQIFTNGSTRTLSLPDLHPRADAEVTSLRHDAGLVIWVGTSRGLFRLDTARGSWTDVHPGQPPGLSDGWTLPDSSIWTSHSGALFRNDQKLLVSDGVIQDVYTTGDNLVWISTLRDGVYALSRPRVKVTDRHRGLEFENLYGVALGPDGRLWLGSLDGEIQVLSNGLIDRYGKERGLPGKNPWAVVVAPNRTVYVATYQPGLYALHPDSERFAAVVLPDELTTVQLRALSIGPDGRLWVGGEANVWRLDGEVWVRRCAGQLEGARVQTIHHAAGDTRWYGTSRGLWRESPAGCQAIAGEQLGDVEIRDIHEDDHGVLWVSTQGQGLIRIEVRADQSGDQPGVMRIGRRQGLPSNSPHAVVEDQAGNLWINSNQGVFRLARIDLERFVDNGMGMLSPLLLTRADGLRDLEGNGGVQPAAAVDGEGRIFFPSQSGLISIDPDRLAVRDSAPTSVIDGLVAGGVDYDIHQELQLPAGQRHVQIRFAAADLRGGPDRFRYRLIGTGRGGEETDFNEIIDQNATSFAALAPGHYRFEVVAGNNDGAWGSQATMLAFSVPAYWYESRLFRWGSLVLGLLGIGWLAFYRLQYLQRQATALNREVALRTHELAGEKSRAEQALAQLADAHQSLEQTHDELAQRNRTLAAQTDRLESLDRFRKRLLADVSHELRTPLMLIDLPLAELDDKADRQTDGWDSSMRRSLTLARRQTERLGELVSQLVTLVQAESGQLELKIRRFDLDALIDDLVQSYAPLARQHGIELIAGRPAVPTPVFADREQLTTALGNLIDNAIKHSESGGHIDIQRRVDDDESRVRINVVDQGHGFDPAIASRLFERFFRDETGPKAGHEGLGIGLALVREIIELHGGRIGAESRPGQGATFWVELPLGSSHIALADLALDQPDPALIPAAETPADARQHRLALVEDHPELAAYLKERLMEFLPVTLFTSAEQALAEIDRQPFGMLLSDVVLPGLSGIELCRRVRQHAELADLPIILVSAKASAGDRAAAVDAGANDYLIKPFSFDELLSAIGKVWPALSPMLQGPDTAPGDPLMRPAVDHLTAPAFGVDDWARAVHLSPRQLRRRVAEICGQSPLVWLREQRLLRVRQLISTGECKTLAEAGAHSGLDNPAYLYRLYKARFGENSEQ